MERTTAISSLICGVVLGAAVAVLLAPESGERTRRKLLNQAERGRKTILESGQEMFERGRELYERGREIAEDAAEMFERGKRIAEKTINERI
ncbi:MAG: YtxH domain-containing protein [Acidobacteriaceae bacterium]|nr:YtxH domain-containing protein [Acidobacteriaceae bacterium]MBV9296976.1 YtxH domain-containing protein [Acidobacteriaceae bacterium]